MRTWRTLALSASSLFIAGVFAQDTLQLADAIQLAMANEHGIRIAKNDAAIAQAQATVGNAGLLPSLDASGRANYSNQYSKLDFAPGIQDVERSGVESTTLAGQVGLAYTLFNGMGNFATYERAQLNELLADLRTRAQVEGTLSQVIALYYGIAAMDEDVAITQRILEISADRFARQEGKASLGGVGRLDVLNAKVDLQADSTTYILAKQRRDRSVRDLNVLMGRSSATSMQVSRRVDHVRVLAEDQLVQEAMNGNVLLVSATAQVRAAEVDQRIAKALRWPKLDLNAAYGINDQKNEVGVVLGTYTQGFNGGLTVSVPLFNGGRITTQMEAARLRAENAVIAEQQARLQVERDVRNAYATWSSQREVLRIQSDAVNTAQINFERTRELFQAGQLTGLQFRQAQLDLANAERQSVVSGFDTKVAELILLRASGGLTSALGIQP
ncbi:MAG: TolC family protein [Flavobacteriales bacterium]|jgi:outer membrane protein|nr:TolC family protein [Flavobacteriales bacterium]MBK6884611.1 TolC family protein [Flavobacteriales bacterium]MBK7103647.1 TolC family protein [Flavobacteriales bacterium]MBK7111695.1 TolC family protein [Flavobacteriales bacterium]MBK7483943.1 TolC family protein [Flavobacteriales bacterium]